MGADGLLSGAGSVVAALQVELFEAVKSGDLNRAMAVNDRLYPLQQAFYAEPFLDMHNRMKESLVILGLLERAVVRPPLMKLSDREIALLGDDLGEARLST
jgi:4-hydroxy-tetrahydrodipicolinate synthase